MKTKNILLAIIIFASVSATAQVPANGLAGYWPFDGNANDISGNGNNGNANGLSYASDATGTVAVFHETSSVIVSDNGTLDFSSVSGVTIAARVKQETRTNGYVLIKMGPGGSGDDEYSLYLTEDGNVAGGFIQSTSNLKGISSVKVLSLNTWYDIVLVWKNNGNICLYIDGAMDNSTTSSVTSIQNTSVPLVIGDPNMNAPHSLVGSMQDISIYNRALTDQEIAAFTDKGLVAYYPFNGNANDESGNGNNGTVHGATLTSDRCGNPGEAYLFNGINSYIEIDHSASLDFNQQISISFWTRFNSSAPYYFPYHIIDKGNAWNTGLRERDINWGVTTDSGYFNAWTQNFELNKFYYLTLTYDGSTVSTYVDGQIKASAQAGGLIKTNTDNVFIGEYPPGGDYYFDGTLDDMRIYNRKLEPGEILALYSEGKCFETVYDTTHVTIYDTIPVNPNIPSNGLVAYYPFNGNANDMSGKSFNGTAYDVTLASDRFNVPNSAYSFSGSTSSYINTGTSPNLSFSNEITLAAWVKGTGNHNDILRIKGTIDDGHEIGSNSSGYALANFFTTGTNINLQSSTIVNDGSWHFIAATFSNKTAKLYVDAVSVAEQNNADNLTMTTPGSITIGKNPVAGTPYSGLIDDARIYNRALTPTEIAALLNEGKCSEIIYDTVHVQVFDTVIVYKEISVTDTLIIDVLLTGVQAPDDINTLIVYPNPAKDILIINTGNYAEMPDYSIKIVNQLGATVFETTVTLPSYEINLSTWTGKGVYMLGVYDNNKVIKAVKKIILQ